MYISRENYKELETIALERGTTEDLANLAKWFEKWGWQYWNGECYTIDKSINLYPIYDLDNVDEDGVPSLSGWEIR